MSELFSGKTVGNNINCSYIQRDIYFGTVGKRRQSGGKEIQLKTDLF